MVDKYNKQKGGEFSKDLSTWVVEFQGRFSLDNIVIIIFEGDKVKGCDAVNSIVVKPLDASSMDYDYLVVNLS